MNNLHYGQPLTVEVREGRLVIGIGIDVLAHAVTCADWANPYDEERDAYIRTFGITDAELFAKDVVAAMQDEREDGSTPLSDFLDKVTSAAVEDGSIATVEASIPFNQTAPYETWATRLVPTPPQEPQP